MKKDRSLSLAVNSIRFRIISIIIIIFIILISFILSSNHYSIKLIRRQAYDTNKRTLSLYMQQIDEEFAFIDRYLSGWDSSSTNLRDLENEERTIESYILEHRIEKQLQQMVYSNQFIDSMFIYTMPQEVFLNATHYDVSYEERYNVPNYIKSVIIENKNIISEMENKWNILEINKNFYLLRLLKYGNTYAGAWINIERLLESIQSTDYEDMTMLLFVDNNGIPMSPNSDLSNIIFPLDSSAINTKDDLIINDSRYIVINSPSKYGNFNLVATIYSDYILAKLPYIYIVILIFIVILIILIPFFLLIFNVMIFKPLDKLVIAMNALANGDLEVELEDKYSPNEFITINKTFKDMAKQIRDLKINVYEEKLGQQKAELNHLQLQSNPHLLINCLNIIYSLATTKKYELIQKMAVLLSDHLRFSLAERILVSLKEEITHVENYLEIQYLRFPHSFKCSINYDKDLQNISVPPMILYTFVDNTIKHQVIAGEFVEILITIEKTKDDMVYIKIIDTGEGFAPDILESINKGKKINGKTGRHLGIYNIFQRLHIIYLGEEKMMFSNEPNSGARIDIYIPLG